MGLDLFPIGSMPMDLCALTWQLFYFSLCFLQPGWEQTHSVTCLSPDLNYSHEHPGSCSPKDPPSAQAQPVSHRLSCFPADSLCWGPVGIGWVSPISLTVCCCLTQFPFQHQEISALKNLCGVWLSLGQHRGSKMMIPGINDLLLKGMAGKSKGLLKALICGLGQLLGSVVLPTTGNCMSLWNSNIQSWKGSPCASERAGK